MTDDLDRLHQHLIDAGGRWRETVPFEPSRSLWIDTTDPRARGWRIAITAVTVAAVVGIAIAVPAWLLDSGTKTADRIPSADPSVRTRQVEEDVSLSTPVKASGAGPQDVELGPAPAGTTKIRVKFDCLTPGTFVMPDGSKLGCNQADIDRRPALASRGIEYGSEFRLPFAGDTSLRVRTQAQARWKLEADYIKTRIKTVKVPAAAPFKVNKRGQTVGEYEVGGPRPDLIPGRTDDGSPGYFRLDDVWSEDLPGPDRYVPPAPGATSGYVPGPTPDLNGDIKTKVYDFEGTVIGEFTLAHVSSR